MRAAAPLIHTITSFVAMGMVANVMLAAGAAPAMVHAREDASEFAALASALTINTGTLEPDWLDAMLWSAESARAAARPWVLDPDAVGRTGYRRQAGAALMARRPSAIRANAGTVLALAAIGSLMERPGEEAGLQAAEDAARDLARRLGTVVALTGETDFVTDGERAALIGGGHAVMPRVAALGGGLSGVVAAFLVAADDPFDATCAALAYYATAGEAAGRASAGPGSFVPAFLDALTALAPDVLDARAQVSAA